MRGASLFWNCFAVTLVALAGMAGCAHTGENAEPRGGMVYFHGSIDSFEGEPSLGLGFTLERFGEDEAEKEKRK